MNKSLTKRVRTSELILEVMRHKHKDELVDIMYQQIQDDNDYQYQTLLVKNTSLTF